MKNATLVKKEKIKERRGLRVFFLLLSFVSRESKAYNDSLHEIVEDCLGPHEIVEGELVQKSKLLFGFMAKSGLAIGLHLCVFFLSFYFS